MLLDRDQHSCRHEAQKRLLRGTPEKQPTGHDVSLGDSRSAVYADPVSHGYPPPASPDSHRGPWVFVVEQFVINEPNPDRSTAARSGTEDSGGRRLSASRRSSVSLSDTYRVVVQDIAEVHVQRAHVAHCRPGISACWTPTASHCPPRALRRRHGQRPGRPTDRGASQRHRRSTGRPAATRRGDCFHVLGQQAHGPQLQRARGTGRSSPANLPLPPSPQSCDCTTQSRPITRICAHAWAAMAANDNRLAVVTALVVCVPK